MSSEREITKRLLEANLPKNFNLLPYADELGVKVVQGKQGPYFYAGSAYTKFSSVVDKLVNDFKKSRSSVKSAKLSKDQIVYYDNSNIAIVIKDIKNSKSWIQYKKLSNKDIELIKKSVSSPVKKEYTPYLSYNLKLDLGRVFSLRGVDISIEGPKELDTRYLGTWEVSNSDRINNPNEDFEDWDWEVPTKETVRKIEDFLRKIQKEKNVKITYRVEEKNYIRFFIKD